MPSSNFGSRMSLSGDQGEAMEAGEGCSSDRKGKAIVVEKDEKDQESGEKAIVDEMIEEKDLPEAAEAKESEAEELVSLQEAIDWKGKAIMVEKYEADLESRKKAIVEETIEEKKDPTEALSSSLLRSFTGLYSELLSPSSKRVEQAKAEENIDASMFVGEKESTKNLESEYAKNTKERAKIKVLAESYAKFRRIKSDDGLFYGVLLFAHMEHIWTTRDRAEVERLRARLTLCKWTNDVLGKPCARFEEYKEVFVQLLNEQIEENVRPRSYQEFLTRIRSQWPLTSICEFLHEIASNESARQAAEVLASPTTDYSKVHEIVGGCRQGIPYQRQLSALSNALGVAVRVVLLDDQVDLLRRPKIYHEDYSPSSEWKVPEWSRRPFTPDCISPDEMARTMEAARDAPNRSIRHILLFRSTAQANHLDILYPN